MLLFRSEAEVQEWCVANNRTPGEILPLSQVWELAKAWYHNRLSPDYRGRSPEQVVEVFESVGLTSSFWKPV